MKDVVLFVMVVHGPGGAWSGWCMTLGAGGTVDLWGHDFVAAKRRRVAKSTKQCPIPDSNRGPRQPQCRVITT